MNEKTIFALGALWFLSQQGKPKDATRRPGRAVAPRDGARWPALLASVGAGPKIAAGLERAAQIRQLAPSPVAASQLFEYFKAAWNEARKRMPATYVPNTNRPREATPEDKLFFGVIQVSDPSMMNGLSSNDSQSTAKEMRSFYRGTSNERALRVVDAASHVAWGTPLKPSVEGET